MEHVAQNRRVKTQDFICEECGKVFRDCRIRKFCSMSCRKSHKLIREGRLCIGCGSKFECHPDDPKQYCTQWCSTQHRPITHKKLSTCEECGHDFITRKDQLGRFCSNLCRSKFAGRQPKLKSRRPENFVTILCEECGNPRVIHKGQMNGRNARFCSRKCKYKSRSSETMGSGNPNWKNAPPKVNYGPNWSAQRKAALQRDGNKCTNCHKTKKIYNGKVVLRIDVHHIKPARLFNGDWLKANELNNLITLCRKCHIKVERHGYPCPIPA